MFCLLANADKFLNYSFLFIATKIAARSAAKKENHSFIIGLVLKVTSSSKV